MKRGAFIQILIQGDPTIFTCCQPADITASVHCWGLQGYNLLAANEQHQRRTDLGKKGPSVRGVGGSVASNARRYCLVVQKRGKASDGMSAREVYS